jgi:hypothetical protein
MPHHRRAKDDRHTYAAVSRFIDRNVLSALKVVDEAVERSPVKADQHMSIVVDIDALWG